MTQDIYLCGFFILFCFFRRRRECDFDTSCSKFCQEKEMD